MKPELDLEKVRNEVLRKIGRNVVLYQQIEKMLKFLITVGKHSGYASEIQTKLEQKAATIHHQTMGQVAGQFLDNVYSDNEESEEAPEELKEVHLSFRFNLECDAVYYETKKQALASIVADRNELIHHLLPKFNPQSIESCLETDQYLDQQREKILPQHEELRNLVNAVQEGIKEHAEFINSEEGGDKLNFYGSDNLGWLYFSEKSQNKRQEPMAGLC